jgi:hypothetical protein
LEGHRGARCRDKVVSNLGAVRRRVFASRSAHLGLGTSAPLGQMSRREAKNDCNRGGQTGGRPRCRYSGKASTESHGPRPLRAGSQSAPWVGCEIEVCGMLAREESFFLPGECSNSDSPGRIRCEENPNATRNAGQEPGISSWMIGENGIPLRPPWRGTLGTRGRVGGGRREA